MIAQSLLTTAASSPVAFHSCCDGVAKLEAKDEMLYVLILTRDEVIDRLNEDYCRAEHADAPPFQPLRFRLPVEFFLCQDGSLSVFLLGPRCRAEHRSASRHHGRERH